MAARRLIETCDVVVATMRPHALTRLGLDFESVRAINPSIVYCQAQGFPLSSPRANEPAYDDIIQAASGVSDMMERVWDSPALLPTIFADKVCGLVMAQAIVAALFHRERTGEGQHVEVPMQQATRAFMLAEHGAGAISEPPSTENGLPAAGYARVLSRERRPHLTKDGQVHLFPYLPKHYAAIFADAGVHDADKDPRYVDQRATLQNSDSLYRDIRRSRPAEDDSRVARLLPRNGHSCDRGLHAAGDGRRAAARHASVRRRVPGHPADGQLLGDTRRPEPPGAVDRTAHQRRSRRARELGGAGATHTWSSLCDLMRLF